jgi:hypothetical protein
MQKIFPISLEGLGTWEVESFGSYLHRAAYEHGVYVGELIRFVYRAAVEAGLKRSDHVLLPNSFDISEVIRANRLAETLVFFFEAASGQSLKSGTFIQLGNSVGRSSHAICKGFCWCPECLMGDVEAGGHPYFRLIWHFRSIKFCSIHRSPLVDRCTFCGSKQNSFARKWPILHCQECARPLSLRKQRLRALDMASSWDVPGADLLQLIDDLSEDSCSVVSKAHIDQSLDKLRQYYGFRSREEDFFILLSRAEFREVLFKGNNVSLKRLRRIAFKLGVSISDLITGNAEKTSELLDSAWVKAPPSELSAAGKPVPRNHFKVLLQIFKIVATSKSPLSMKEVARRAEVSLGYLAYRYPKLMKEISVKHEEYRKDTQNEKHFLANRLATSFFVDKKYGIYRKSRKEAYRVLSEESGLPKFMLKRAIAEAYLKLF